MFDGSASYVLTRAWLGVITGFRRTSMAQPLGFDLRGFDFVGGGEVKGGCKTTSVFRGGERGGRSGP